MRPREQARRDEQHRQHADRRQGRPAEVASGGAGDDEHGERRRRARQQRDADEAAGLVGQRQQDFAQPFVRDPGLAGNAEGEGVGAGNRVMRENPVAGGDMGPGVAVVEDRRREGAEREHRQRQRMGDKGVGKRLAARARGGEGGRSQGHERQTGMRRDKSELRALLTRD